jgi:NTP pyrophosphatase (non-canonical NTP hydrolase)
MIDSDLLEMLENFAFYQEKASETAIYDPVYARTYPLLGLVGEVGEFANKYKKVLRDGKEFALDDMVSELGDILWYLSTLARDCGIGLDYIAAENLIKLSDRKERGVIGGSGDKR